MICKTQKYRYIDLTPRHCQCIVLAYLTSEFIWIRGILVVFHSLLLFMFRSSGSLCIRTASRICLFVGSFLHRTITFISKRCTSFWCTFTQCFHSALSSFFFSRSLRCFFPRVYVFCPVWPPYSYWHSPWQVILYVTPESLQLPGFSPRHTKQSPAGHSFALNGSFRWSIRTSFVPLFSITLIFTPFFRISFWISSRSSELGVACIIIIYYCHKIKQQTVLKI